MKSARRVVHPLVITMGLAPAAVLSWRALADDLGANPVEALAHETGQWTLRLLLLTLAVTPLRRLFGWSWLAPERRTLGLLAFLYACLHFATYGGLDLGLELGLVAEDIVERPYITLGFTSFVLLVPLAATSTKRAVRRLGGRRWTHLHRLVYVAAVAGVLHFIWQAKADLREPLVYAAVLAALLAARAAHSIARRTRASP